MTPSRPALRVTLALGVLVCCFWQYGGALRAPLPAVFRSVWRAPSSTSISNFGDAGSDSEWTREKEYRCLWRLRRKLSRALATPLIKGRLQREQEGGEGERPMDSSSSDGLDFATLLSIGFVAVAVTVLRFGGRAAFVSFLGLDFMMDSNIKSNLDEFLSYFQGLGTVADFALFLAGWTVAKTFCIDLLTIFLAISSGLLFGGFWQGTLASVIASSTASSLNFQVVRQFFGEKVGSGDDVDHRAG